MKKYLALLLAGVMMLSLVACGEKQTTDDEQTGNEAGNGSLSSIVDLNTDWLPYDENGNLKLTERDAEGKNGVVTSANYYASKIGEKNHRAGRKRNRCCGRYGLCDEHRGILLFRSWWRRLYADSFC